MLSRKQQIRKITGCGKAVEEACSSAKKTKNTVKKKTRHGARTLFLKRLNGLFLGDPDGSSFPVASLSCTRSSSSRSSNRLLVSS